MSERKDAPERLLISNLHFERNRSDDVKIFSTGGRPLCTIHREDWDAVAEFFSAISQRGVLL